MLWTPEQDARLRELAALGLYAQEVVEILTVEWKDFTLNRNKVIGRAARMKPRLAWAHPPVGGEFTHTERSRRAVEARRLNPSRRQRRKLALKAAMAGMPYVEPEPPPDEPVTVGLPLMKLAAHHCRHPQGERDYLFCAAPRLNGFSYCAFHQLLTHRERTRK